MYFMRTSAGAAAAALVLAACSSGSPTQPPPPPGPPASLALISAPTTLPVATLAADSVVVKVLDASGRGVPSAAVTWNAPFGMLSPNVSLTDAQGLARAALRTGTFAGSIQLSATTLTTQGPAVANFIVHVTPGPPATLRLLTTPSAMGRYGRRQLSAEVTDAYGNVIANAVTWGSSNTAVATITSDGLLTAVGAGTTTVSARAGSIQQNLPITVSTELISDSFDTENGGTARLSYTQLTTWAVTRGDVDLIGRLSDWDFVPGNGLYLDLDGYYNGGRIESRDTFVLPAGSYTLAFRLAGSHRGDFNVVTVSVGDLFTEQFARASGEDFVPVVRTITVPAAGATVRVVFDQGGNDGYGALLDNVQFVRN